MTTSLQQQARALGDPTRHAIFRYLADAGAKVIHEDETGRLVRREAGDEPIIAVQVVCPTTGRQYVLRVPPQTKTAREGVAWTFGLPAALYQPTIQS